MFLHLLRQQNDQIDSELRGRLQFLQPFCQTFRRFNGQRDSKQPGQQYKYQPVPKQQKIRRLQL